MLLRAESNLKQILANIFVKLNLNHFIIESIKLSKDSRHATVHILIVQPEKKIEEIDLLRFEINKLLQQKLNKIPHLKFIEDPHAARIEKTLKLLKEIEIELEQNC